MPTNRIIVASKASITAASLMIRQNGQYMHGTGAAAASMLVDGITNTCAVTEVGLRVRLTKAAGWGGTNNDPIEMEGSMTVAFS